MSYDEAVKILQAKGSEIQWGGDFGGTDETLLTEEFDRPVMVDRYPDRDQGVLHAARSASGRKWRWASTCSRPKATARSSAAASAFTISTAARKRIEEHNLPHEAFEWYLDLRRYGTRAARRLRHGHRALRRLDLRARARARNHRVSRACCTALRPVNRRAMRRSHIAIIGAPLDLGAGRRGVDMGPPPCASPD